MRNAECGVRSAECGMRSAECGVRETEFGNLVSEATFGVAGAKAPVRPSHRRFSLRFIEKKNCGETNKKR